VKKLLLILALVGWCGSVGATNYCTDVSNAPSGCYNIENGSGQTVTDQSSNGYDGAFLNSTHPTWSTSVPGSPFIGTSTKSLLFDGASGYVVSSTLSNMFQATYNASGVAWIYPSGLGEGNNGRIFSRYDESAVNFQLFLTGTNTLRFYRSGSTALNVVTSNNKINLTQWNHVAFTWDGSVTATNVHIYVNGTETTYQTQTNGNTFGSFYKSGDFYIGNRQLDDGTFYGNIDEASTFLSILTSTQINDIMDNGLIQSAGATLGNSLIRGGSLIQGGSIVK
jgi:hypothetical protein